MDAEEAINAESESLRNSTEAAVAEQKRDLQSAKNPEVRPIAQKGFSLQALKHSLSLFSDKVDYTADPKLTDEENELAKSQVRQLRLEEDSVQAALEKWREENEILKKAGLSTGFGSRPMG